MGHINICLAHPTLLSITAISKDGQFRYEICTIAHTTFDQNATTSKRAATINSSTPVICSIASRCSALETFRRNTDSYQGVGEQQQCNLDQDRLLYITMRGSHQMWRLKSYHRFIQQPRIHFYTATDTSRRLKLAINDDTRTGLTSETLRPDRTEQATYLPPPQHDRSAGILHTCSWAILCTVRNLVIGHMDTMCSERLGHS